MSVPYRVELTVGPLSWSIERGDPPAFPAGVDVLDGLSVGWTMPEGDLWPAQPNPTILTFSLLSPSADQLNDVDINTPVTLLIYAGVVDASNSDMPSVRFVGRVSDLAGVPMAAGGQQGWRLDVTAVDLVAALADENIAGFSVDPLTEYASPYGWIYGYFEWCGLPPVDWNFGSNEHSTLANPMVKMAPATLLEATDNLLTRYADAGPCFADPYDTANHVFYNSQGWRRGIIVPNLTGDNVLHEDTPYVIEWVSRRAYATLSTPVQPGRLWHTDGVWSVEITPPPATTWDPFFEEETIVADFGLAISADYLDRGATWSRTKFDDANRIILTAVSGSDWNEPDTWNRRTVNAPNPRPVPYERVTAQLGDVRVVDPVYARRVGELYVADAYDYTGNRYEAESFTWYASRDPQWPIYRGLFPDNTYTSLWLGGFSSPITITDLPAEQSPNGSRYYTGTLKGASWTFAGGEFSIGLSLYARVPRPMRQDNDDLAVSAFTWRGMENLDPAPSWEQLNPADTWLDWRLVRPLGTDHPLGP